MMHHAVGEWSRTDFAPFGFVDVKMTVAPRPVGVFCQMLLKPHQAVSHQLQEDRRWQWGLPPTGNANYAWLQHMLYHLSSNGRAGIVLANGSMSTSTTAEAIIRQAMVDADLVDCMVALPPQLFFNTQIPACLWFLNRAKPDHRQGQTLFIDARNMGSMVDRTRRELDEEDLLTIATTYREWRTPEGDYEDQAGFCKSATIEDIVGHNYVLTPGRYVGAPDMDEDDEPFEEKMARLTATLNEQFAESARLEAIIRQNLSKLGYDG